MEEKVHLRSDGTIDAEFYANLARSTRSAYVFNAIPSIPPVSPTTKRRAKIFAVACLLAASAFWATMMAAPPTTQAADPAMSITEIYGSVGHPPSLVADAH